MYHNQYHQPSGCRDVVTLGAIAIVIALVIMAVLAIGDFQLFEDGSARFFGEGFCLIARWGCG